MTSQYKAGRIIQPLKSAFKKSHPHLPSISLLLEMQLKNHILFIAFPHAADPSRAAPQQPAAFQERAFSGLTQAEPEVKPLLDYSSKRRAAIVQSSGNYSSKQ